MKHIFLSATVYVPKGREECWLDCKVKSELFFFFQGSILSFSFAVLMCVKELLVSGAPPSHHQNTNTKGCPSLAVNERDKWDTKGMFTSVSCCSCLTFWRSFLATTWLALLGLFANQAHLGPPIAMALLVQAHNDGSCPKQFWKKNWKKLKMTSVFRIGIVTNWKFKLKTAIEGT